jgi:3-oxoacyl-[acyl-carrier-protein] synthase-3
MLDYGRDLGHLSVSDHPAALTHLIVTGQIGVGDRVLMVNNGAGMSLTVAVIRIESMPQWPQITRHRTVRRNGATWNGHHCSRATVLSSRTTPT